MQRDPGTTRQEERQYSRLSQWYGRIILDSGAVGRTFETRHHPDHCTRDYREFVRSSESTNIRFRGSRFEVVKMGSKKARMSQPAPPREPVETDQCPRDRAKAVHFDLEPNPDMELRVQTEDRVADALDRIHNKPIADAARRAGL